MHMTPYVAFNGNAEEALEFYRTALGGSVTMDRYEGSPMEKHMPPDWGKKLIHGELDSPHGVLMVSDASGEHYAGTGGNVSIALHPETFDEGRTLFERLSAGGTVHMEFQETYWAAGFGMCSDRFGTNWMVNVRKG